MPRTRSGCAGSIRTGTLTPRAEPSVLHHLTRVRLGMTRWGASRAIGSSFVPPFSRLPVTAITPVWNIARTLVTVAGGRPTGAGFARDSRTGFATQAGDSCRRGEVRRLVHPQRSAVAQFVGHQRHRFYAADGHLPQLCPRRPLSTVRWPRPGTRSSSDGPLHSRRRESRAMTQGPRQLRVDLQIQHLAVRLQDCRLACDKAGRRSRSRQPLSGSIFLWAHRISHAKRAGD